VTSRHFDGAGVLITGAARGQGRSHAVAFAREGADVAICDICADVDTVPYQLGRDTDLDETAALCEAAGARVVRRKVDVRDYAEVEGFAGEAIDAFGKVDIVIANAGILSMAPIVTQTPEMFADTIDTNLKGVFHTIRAVLPQMVERKYGRIIATGSIASIITAPNLAHYVAAKHGVAGLIGSIAREVADDGITANFVVPNSVATTMIRNDAFYALISPEEPTEEASKTVMARDINVISLPWVQPEDVSRVVLFLASPDSRHITGTGMKIDLGATA
jgi:SDR family mycofactocin-dependent oxidoreductase